ncbi:MAG: hypothetical protein H7Z43_00575 [Clostridia bacterium]|nr:hypothetical protein [Deltaproteobacteria bacterium]
MNTTTTTSIQRINGRDIELTQDHTGGVIKAIEVQKAEPGVNPYRRDVTDEFLLQPQRGGPGNHPWTPRRSKLPANPANLAAELDNTRAEAIVKDPTAHALHDVLRGARRYFSTQALGFAKQLSAAVEPTSGLIAMNVERNGDAYRPTNANNSALDAARTTKGLAQLATAYAKAYGADAKTVSELFERAAANWEATRHWLRTEHNGRQLPIHLRTADGIQLGEGEDATKRRVNADGLYPVSDSADMVILARELGEPTEEYRAALIKDVQEFVRDFYNPEAKTFNYHIDANTGSSAETDTKNGLVVNYPNGIVGNDGAIYGLAALLIPTLKALGSDVDSIASTPSFTTIVKQQLDFIADRATFKNGAMWETYTVRGLGELEPVRFAWQDAQVEPWEEGLPTQSHVAIGGHIVMAARQLAEGALELHKIDALNNAELTRYLDRATEIINFAVRHAVINSETGLVQNANMLEVPDGYPQQRTRPGGNDWGQAGWQQRELIQTLLVLRKANRLGQIQLSPDGSQNGEDLLRAAIATTAKGFDIPDGYTGGFGDEHRYHVPQLAAYLLELT